MFVSAVLPQYQRVTNWQTDGQTDGQMDGIAISVSRSAELCYADAPSKF